MFFGFPWMNPETGWWVPRASGVIAPLAFDFAHKRAIKAGKFFTPDALLTVTNASGGYVLGSNGLYQAVGANTLRYHWDTSGNALGILVETTKNNRCRRNRDLTNSIWVKTNCSASLNQTGIDGGANVASSLTASSDNATCLQTISAGSTVCAQSAFVKRISGSGVINMTQDNGATWTPITVTGAWTRVTIPTQTLTNPIVGFQIVTNGDAIAVDFAQNENGSYVSSPILTTSSLVTRSADAISMTLPAALQSLSAYGLFAIGNPTGPPTTFTSNSSLAGIDDASLNNRMLVQRGAGDPMSFAAFANAAGSTTHNVHTGTWSPASIAKLMVAGATGDYASYHDGAQIGTSATSGFPSGVTTLRVGQRQDATLQFDGTISQLALWGSRVSNAEMARLTT